MPPWPRASSACPHDTPTLWTRGRGYRGPAGLGGPWHLPRHDSSGPLHPPQTREHLAKAQRGLPGEGVSEVIQTLVEISQDGTSYSGDLLSTIDVLRNMTEIFRRAYYSPTPGDVQVGCQRTPRGRVPGTVAGEPSWTPVRG